MGPRAKAPRERKRSGSRRGVRYGERKRSRPAAGATRTTARRLSAGRALPGHRTRSRIGTPTRDRTQRGRRHLDGQAFTALFPARGDDLTSVFRAHAFEKTMDALAAPVVRLESTFHASSSSRAAARMPERTRKGRRKSIAAKGLPRQRRSAVSANRSPLSTRVDKLVETLRASEPQMPMIASLPASHDLWTASPGEPESAVGWS